MEPREEQDAEIEALEAIFMEDFSLTNPAEEGAGARFIVSLAPDGAPDVRIRMIFRHGVDYPTSQIQVTADSLSGLSAPRRRKMQVVAEECASENIGLPSAFTICEAVKEWIEETVGTVEEEEADDGVFETRDVTLEAKVEVISQKAIGTPVTLESFAEWREKFDAEMEGRRTAAEKAREIEMLKKPTGRELFEMNKAVVSSESESFWEAEAEAET